MQRMVLFLIEEMRKQAARDDSVPRCPTPGCLFPSWRGGPCVHCVEREQRDELTREIRRNTEALLSAPVETGAAARDRAVPQAPAVPRDSGAPAFFPTVDVSEVSDPGAARDAAPRERRVVRRDISGEVEKLKRGG